MNESYAHESPSEWSQLSSLTSLTNQPIVSQLSPREKQAINYNQKLREKFQYHPQVRRITKHRHLPKALHHQRKELQVMKEARRRKYVFIFFPLFFPELSHLFVLPR